MINVSNDFKKRMEESRNFKDYAQVTFADGSEITLDSDQFVPTNSALSDGDDTGFPIGVAVQKNVQLEIINDDQQYATKDFLGAKIRLYIEFATNDDGTVERIEKGTYTVITPETYGETVIITAYDDMYKADKDYTTALTFPQTAKSVLLDICDKCDISLGSTSFLHDNFQIQTKPTGKFREVIGQIAMIACGNARIDRQNRLQIMPYNLEWGYDAGVVAGENLFSVKNSVDGYLSDSNDGTINSGHNNGERTSDYIEVSVGNVLTIQTWATAVNTTGNYYMIDYMWFSDKSADSHIGRKTRVFGGQLGFNHGIAKTIPAPDTAKYIRVSARLYKDGKIKVEKGDTTTPYVPNTDDKDSPYLLLDEFTAPKIEYNDTVITGFKTVIKGETSEDDTEILQGADTYCITVENPLISGKEDTVLSWLLERIGNVPFRPFSGDAISNPLVEFMDLAKVKDRRGNEYNTFVTDVNFLMPGYTTLKNSTPSATRSAIAYTSNSARVEQRARQLVELEKNARELAVERLQEALGNASGMYSTDVKQQDGSIIRYLHDKPTLAESKNIIKITSEAIGFSNDGKTYPYGITLNGETITRLLYAEGIDADYINAGAITVRDSGGNIIFQVDMDTKSVTISGDHVRIGGKSATTALADNLTEAKNYSDGKLSDYANTVSKSISGLQEQIDGQIETFYYDYEPSLQNVPANAWTSETERQKHQGDLFYNKKTGYAYRFFKDGSTWKWQLIQDTDITKAMQTAETAKDTADNKRRVFVVTPQPPYDIGDLWTNGTDVLTCAVARAQGAAYVQTDWQKLNKYTDDTVANQALEEARNSRALQINLDNDYQGIPVNADGSYTTFPECKTRVTVYYGHTDVSTQCTYPTPQTSSGITGSWNSATRTYTVTGLSTDTGWVDITASYMSLFTVTKRFNVAKVRAGAVGEQGTQGINLALGSGTQYSNTSYPTHTYTLSEALEDNATYTVTLWGTLASDRTRWGMWTHDGHYEIVPLAKIKDGLYKGIAVFNSSRFQPGYTDRLRVSLFPFPGTGGSIASTITKIKIEKGSVNNPVWTPAPQDLVGPQGPQGATGAQGPKGDTGAAGRTYFIELSANVLKRGANNAVTPATITANAYYRDGTSATRVAYAGRWIVATSTDGNSFSTLATSSADEATHSQAVGTLAVNIVAVRFTLCAAGGTTTALDMQTAPVLIDVANLTHEQIFNLLTNNGALKGIYQEGSELYVNATYIKSGTIAADRIGAGSITSGKIASGAVTADKLSVIALSAISADLGTITAGIIQSPDFKMSNYAPGTSAATGTVLSGCRLSLTDKAFYTPQITIKEDYIQLIGYITVGSRKSGAAIGAFSSALGITNVASGYGSHAEGADTTASGMFSRAEGSGTTAKGNSSHAEGINTTADGYSAHAEGYLSKATGDYSHAEGSGEATKNYSHAEGAGTTASGSYSHAEGWLSEATGNTSHAEGYNTTASGSDSHAEGQSCTASASCAHAGGISCNASHSYSFAHGNTLETGANSQFVVGKYNAKDTSLFCVGAGSSATSRKNVFSVSDASAVFDAILRVTTGILLGNASTVAYIYAENNDGNIYFRYTTTAGSTTYSNVRSIVTALSDERKKTNIKPIAYEDIAEFFDRMVPISYGIPSQDDKFHVGFSAQKLEQAMAECGLPDNMAIIQKEPERDEYGSRIPDQYEYRLNYNEIVPILVSKIQQQDREIKALKEEFANLRSEIETIKSNYAHIQ